MKDTRHYGELIAQIIGWMQLLAKSRALEEEATIIPGGLHENPDVRNAAGETVRAVKKTIRDAYARTNWIGALLVHAEMHDFVASCMGNVTGLRRMRLLGEFVKMCSEEDQGSFRKWYRAQPFFEMKEGQEAFVFFLPLEGCEEELRQ